MKKILLFAHLTLAGISVYAQDPVISAWQMNTNGVKGVYKYYANGGSSGSVTTVNMPDSTNVIKVCYDATHVYVRANGLADYVMGPFPGNPNKPAAQNNIFRIPRNPQEETGVKIQASVGEFGVAVNGVVLYGANDARSYKYSTNTNTTNGDGNWFGNAWASEGSTMDAGGAGHPDFPGNYHYHATPFALYTFPSASHSPVIAYAFDGYPIYGPFGYSDPTDHASPVIRMTSSYQLRNITVRTILPDGSTSSPPGPDVSATFPLGTYIEDYEFVNGLGELDEYNGRFCVTPEYPDGTYAYFVTTDDSGDPAFPFIIGPYFYGKVSNMDIGPNAGTATIPSGATCTSVATATDPAIPEQAVSIFPNPASGNVTVEMQGSQGFRATLINSAGQEMGTWETDSFKKTIPLEGMNKGMYLLRVTDNQGRSRLLTFIKE